MIMNNHLDAHPAEAFKIWHYLHKKEYSLESEEGLKRYQNFKKNHELVKKHNSDGSKSYRLGLNHFSDMAINEFRDKYLTGNAFAFEKSKANNNKIMDFWNLSDEDQDDYLDLLFNKPNNPHKILLATNLESIDWVEKANIGKIENQRDCGSCWAFAISQAVQAELYIKKGKSIKLSKQQLVDCESQSNGCNGGTLDTALDYIVKNGLESEEEYPYTAEKNKCNFSDKKIITKINDYEKCIDDKKCTNDESLHRQLSKGPVASVVDASEEFMLYIDGVYDKECKEANHAILLVGYHKKQKDNDTSYWVVKNSWGEIWGENGFIKIKQSEDYNSCLLNTYYARPNIK